MKCFHVPQILKQVGNLSCYCYTRILYESLSYKHVDDLDLFEMYRGICQRCDYPEFKEPGFDQIQVRSFFLKFLTQTLFMYWLIIPTCWVFWPAFVCCAHSVAGETTFCGHYQKFFHCFASFLWVYHRPLQCTWHQYTQSYMWDSVYIWNRCVFSVNLVVKT